MHWVQCTELHKLNDFKSIKTIYKDMKKLYHCLFQNFSNAQVADFKPPKNRLPVGILKFRKNVLVQKVLGYSKLKQSGIVLYFHYLIHLIPGPGLNVCSRDPGKGEWKNICFTIILWIVVGATSWCLSTSSLSLSCIVQAKRWM